MTNIARDFAWVLTQVLDGVKKHELTEQFAIPEDECAKVMNLLAQARAFLDQPEPEELTDEEILQISDQFDINGTEDVTKGMPLDTFFDSYQPQQLIAFARALIAADRATTQGVKK